MCGAVGPDAQYLSILFSLLSFHWLGGGGYCCLVGRCSILQCDNFPELDVLAKHAFLCPFLWGRGAQDVHLDFHTAPEL